VCIVLTSCKSHGLKVIYNITFCEYGVPFDLLYSLYLLYLSYAVGCVVHRRNKATPQSDVMCDRKGYGHELYDLRGDGQEPGKVRAPVSELY
jgi:hypothetical protein